MVSNFREFLNEKKLVADMLLRKLYNLKMFLYEITKVTQKESFFGTKTNFTNQIPKNDSFCVTFVIPSIIHLKVIVQKPNLYTSPIPTEWL
jgi:hypothetical protein